MAVEMYDYTRYNVLQQAATSVLSQANEIPSDSTAASSEIIKSINRRIYFID